MSSQYQPRKFNMLPEVVKNLLIINGLLFFSTYVLANTFGIDLVRVLGLFYPGSELFRPFQVITHLFMHGSMGHIFSNMFALWMFGNVLENVWGGKKFLMFYIVTGLGAALIHLAVISYEMKSMENKADVFFNNPTAEEFGLFMKKNVPLEALSSGYRGQVLSVIDGWLETPSSMEYKAQAVELTRQYLDFRKDIPTVGASGAVFGVLLAFGMMFPNTVIYLYFAIPIKAKYFVMLYGALELYLGFSNNPVDNVAHFAHLGGMLFGFFMIRYWERNKYRRQ